LDGITENTSKFPGSNHAIINYFQEAAALVHGKNQHKPGPQLLPFKKMQVWTHIQVQTVSFHQPKQVLPPETLEAAIC
jgi:hypothetical protein